MAKTWDRHIVEKLSRVEAERDRLKERFEREREWRHRYGATCRDFLVDGECACEECGGSGYRVYDSTATWREGAGGSTMTTDVCDKCWGSGDSTYPWPTHKKEALGETTND